MLISDDSANRTLYILGSDVIGQVTGAAADAPVYFLYDGHGSVRKNTDTTGSVTNSYIYDAYGNRVGSVLTGDGLYYTGEMYDADLAHYYLRSRYYNPSNGRFNSMDTFSGNNFDPQSLHKYLYVHADPLNGIDPTGQGRLAEVVTVIGIGMNFFNLYLDMGKAAKASAEGRYMEAMGYQGWIAVDVLALFMPFSGPTMGAAGAAGGVIQVMVQAGVHPSAVVGYVRAFAHIGEAITEDGVDLNGSGGEGGGSNKPKGGTFMEDEGSGAWYKFKFYNKMAEKYQAFRNGKPIGWDYYYNKVRFDGFRDGKLLECKYNWKGLVSKKTKEFYGFMKYVVRKQARRHHRPKKGFFLSTFQSAKDS